MVLSQREKRLAAAVAALGGLLVVWFGVLTYHEAVGRRELARDAAMNELMEKQQALLRAARANERLAAFDAQSLPRDREMARSLYQNWLVAELNRLRLKQVTVEPGRGTQLRDVYTKLPFTVRARGSLEQVTRWLAAFYRADHLQQIRDLTLTPLADGGELQLTATIEALALGDASRRDALSAKPSERVSEQAAGDAVAAIVERNLFAAYVPPPPPPRPRETTVAAPPPPPAFDPAKYTYLTSIIEVDSRPQAWLNVRPTKQTLRLFVGDGITVGKFSGKLVRIADKEIEIESDGKRRVVALGKSLDQAVELPAAGT